MLYHEINSNKKENVKFFLVPSGFSSIVKQLVVLKLLKIILNKQTTLNLYTVLFPCLQFHIHSFT